MSVCHQVPATTSNLGPGYDCLGLALSLANRVAVRAEPGRSDPMSEEAAAAFFRATGLAPFPFAWEIEGNVSRSRGLGSSVTVRLGILAGLNVLAGEPLGREELYRLAARLEGHPDNAAPATFGGFVVCGAENWCRFEVSDAIRFVLLIPAFEVSTPEARRVLPEMIPHRAAAMSCGHAARITAAFAAQNYEWLRGAFADGLHQPYRQPLIPFLPATITAAEEAGALGGFLSGSGSTICAVAYPDAVAAVSAAMLASAPADCRIVVATADNRGLHRV